MHHPCHRSAPPDVNKSQRVPRSACPHKAEGTGLQVCSEPSLLPLGADLCTPDRSYFFHAFSGLARKASAVIIQRDIRTSLYSVYPVPVRFSVADNIQPHSIFSFASLCFSFPESIMKPVLPGSSSLTERNDTQMNKITSFTIDHIRLVPGIYVSRKDTVSGAVITTFDIRMTSPNDEPVMNTAEVHTIEHLGATFQRNHETWKDRVIYFGPMGCRTGFYLLLAGDYDSADIVPLMKEMFTFIADFEGEVPGAAPKDCGNYLDMNLPMANYLARKYLKEVLENISDRQLIYPE